MEERKLNLNVTGENKEPIVIHLLEGEAPKNFYPTNLEIEGDINAVIDFIATRETLIDKNKSHVIFRESDKSITLIIDETSHLSGKVKASLQTYPDLVEFGINKTKYFTRTEMEKLIRMNRFYFSDKDEHMKVMRDFQSFSAKVNQDIQQSSDQRGNKVNNSTKSVQSDLVQSFVLQIPIFKGRESRKFVVEICFDVTDSAARFWLESVELFELEKAELTGIFSSQKEYLADKNFTIINA